VLKLLVVETKRIDVLTFYESAVHPIFAIDELYKITK